MLLDIGAFIKAVRASLLVVFLVAATASGVEAGGERVIAEGDGFRLTQKEFDDYRSAIAPDTGPADNKALLSAILRYELLSREYAEKQKGMGVEPQVEGPATIEMKVLAAKKYIQQILDDYSLPEDVIVSYYRSYPDKFKTGNAPGGGMSLLPLDDKLKKEIKFTIVEKKKDKIIEETVQNLMSKYHIKIINEYQ